MHVDEWEESTPVGVIRVAKTPKPYRSIAFTYRSTHLRSGASSQSTVYVTLQQDAMALLAHWNRTSAWHHQFVSLS